MWLVNANVVDVLTGERLRGRAVSIGADGRILEVAAAAPVGQSDDQVVDVGGRWLLPGIISCHTHLSVVFPFSDTDESEDPAITAYRSATRAHQALQAGITTIRCVHEQNRADLALRRAAQRGWIRAPRIRGAGRAISTVGGHGEGAAAAYATGEQEFYRAAAAEIEAGADHVKIFITGGLAKAGEHFDEPEMRDEEIRGVVRAAHEHDRYVVAHSGESVAIRQALAQGVTSFEHAYRLDEQTAGLLARPDVFLTPTLCVTRSESWMRANHFEEHSIQQALSAADDHLLSIQRAIRAGVTLVNGTDYPPGDLVDGVPAAVHELLLMAEAGLTPLQALQSISSQAARLLRIDDHVGQIRPGFVGDLIAVEGDPLDDLAALRTISLVVQGGSVVRGARMTPAEPSNRFTDGTPWESLAGYSRAARSGSVIAVSGTTAPGSAATADTYTQTRASLLRVIESVEALGGTVSDIIRTRVMLVPDADVDAACRAHRELLGASAPANSMFFVAGLIGAGLLVEVEADAVLHRVGDRE